MALIKTLDSSPTICININFWKLILWLVVGWVEFILTSCPEESG